MNYLKKYNSNNLILFLLLFIIFLFGLEAANDYGLSWDSMQRSSGIRAAGYIMTKLGVPNSLENEYEKYPRDHNDAYGVIFDLISIAIEKSFELKDKKDIYTMRHRLNFLFYFIGCLFFLLICKNIFNLRIAIISFLIYAIHPRLFAHGFFNPKDAILQAFVIMSLYPILLSFRMKSIKWFIASGIMMGICISTRVVMIYLPFLFILFFAYLNKEKFSISYLKKDLTVIKYIFCTFFFTALSTIIFLPVLWENPITNFKWIFITMKNFPWNGSVLFMGDTISSSELPWYYLLIWFFITTPISFCFLYILGIVRSIYYLSFKSVKQYPLLYFSIFGILIPYISVIIFNSSLYDGWRHFYFVYPFISFISIYGFMFIKKILSNNNSIKNKNIFYLIIIFVIFYSPVTSIFKLHPHQNVYFNFLAGKDPLLKYEGDYWGISYKQGLEKLIELEKNDILLAVGNFPGKNNLQMIEKKDRDRIKIVQKENAKYFITNFRSQINDYKLSKKGLHPYNKEIYKINFGEMKILGLYELP